MKELVTAVENISNKTIVDYLLIIIPIFISVIATIIAINTAKMQKKISLFDRRYEVYKVIKNCIVCAELLSFNIKQSDPKLTDFLFMKAFSNHLILLEDITEEKVNELYNKIYTALQESEFLLSKNAHEEILKLAKGLFDLTISIDRENEHREKILYLVKQAKVVEEKTIPMIQDQLKLK